LIFKISNNELTAVDGLNYSESVPATPREYDITVGRPMLEAKNSAAPCKNGMSRRAFVKKLSGATLAAGALPGLGAPLLSAAAPTRPVTEETAVKRMYDSLAAEQKRII
tara:strand:+ start:176 stop:502 length:327 start_codon:yes stop_codon:yes gene_type:complete